MLPKVEKGCSIAQWLQAGLY